MLAIIYGVLLSIASYGEVIHPAVAVPDTVKLTGRQAKIISPDSLGKYFTVDRIIIIGNKHTRNSIILRELSVKRGDVVNEAHLPLILKKDERKLFNLHLFNTATIQVLDIGNGMIDLLVEVSERWYFFPHPIFKLSDRNFNEWWQNYNHDLSRVNYGIRAHHHNMRGRREDMLITAQFGFQKKFEFVYQIPYINKKQKQGLIFQMDFIENKSVADSTINHKLNYVKSDKVLRNTRGIGLAYTYRNNFYIRHKLKYEYRQTTIADTLQILNPDYLGEKRTFQMYDAISYEFINDHRDIVAYPLKGYLLDVYAEQTGVALQKDITKTEGVVTFSGFLDLKKGFYLANLSYLYASTPNQVPYYNYGAMGYEKIFIRGYEVYVIEGPKYFLNKTTIKKRIFSKHYNLDHSPIEQFNYLPVAVYLKAYADFGYVDNYAAYSKNNINSKLTDRFLGGAGFGIDVVSSYDVVLRVEYSFTSQKTQGFFLHVKKEF